MADTRDTLVWVSGASRGIGRAVAAAVPWPDARVVDISRSGSDLPGVEHLAADLTDPAGWAAVGAVLRDELAGFAGRRVAFVHCAGMLSPVGFVGEVDGPAYTRNVLLNSAAPQALGQAFLEAVRDFDGEKCFVTLTSGAANKVYEGLSSYGAGKAAGDRWVATVGAEQDRRGGCRVLSVAPGVVETAMQAELRASDDRDLPSRSRFAELHDTGQLRSPEDAARQLWAAVRDPGLANGAVVDLREWTPSTSV